MGDYDTAQICLNGHVANDSFHRFPQFNKNFCQLCGEPTIIKCEKCNAPIRGYYHTPGVIGVGAGEGDKTSAGFCYNCGHAYPWTERRLKAARELADEFDSLTEAEREKLKQSLDDLVREGPATEIAVVRFKKIMNKVGRESYDMMKSIITDILSETAKKTLLG